MMSRELAMQRIGKALHDLCQPLTTLQCRPRDGGSGGNSAGVSRGGELGLEECGRLSQAVTEMRDLVRAEARTAAEASMGVAG